jgi:hypothetical protein
VVLQNAAVKNARAPIELWRRVSMHPWLRPWTERRVVRKWQRAGRPIPPPPPVKQAIVRAYQARFGPRVFIETGTFAGSMIDAVRSRFDRVVSIELDPTWHARAIERFRPDSRVTLLLGDSALILPEVLERLTEPALFWLDAHYTGPVAARGALDSPIVRELEAIRAHRMSHVVLIDDIRDFQGGNGYPTAEELIRWIRAAAPESVVEVRDDILRWHPNETRSHGRRRSVHTVA